MSLKPDSSAGRLASEPSNRPKVEPPVEHLKWRLLLRQLDMIQQSELHVLVLHEAQVAAAMAAKTPYPHLLFPCLFEERVAGALERERCESNHYWHRMGIAA
jgi:hypothetical protein